MIIAIDMDGVIEDMLSAWVIYLNKKYKLNKSANLIKYWNMQDNFPELSYELIYSILTTTSFWNTVLPNYSAIKYIKLLILDGHLVYIVTASDYRTIEAKFNCVLFKYFPYLTMDNVIITNHKELVKYDILIDDGIHNLVNDNPGIKLLYDAPYNSFLNEEEYNIIRVYNWTEIYNYIKLISQGV